MKSPFSRGFKAYAEKLAHDQRDELGLELDSPICVFELAFHLGIPLTPLSSWRGSVSEMAYHHLVNSQKTQFSAVTLFNGPRRTVLFNDHHAETRKRADIAHELAHALLQHPSDRLVTEAGARSFNAALEAEATFLGPAILVSLAAAKGIAFSNITLTEAAAEYTVSPALLRFRLNASGASLIARRVRGA